MADKAFSAPERAAVMSAALQIGGGLLVFAIGSE